jgi:hypothetical protein
MICSDMSKNQLTHLKTGAYSATRFVMAFFSAHRLVNSIPVMTLVWRDQPAKQCV